MTNLPDMSANPDPRTLLLPDPDVIPSLLGDKGAAIFGASACVIGVLVNRYITRRPLKSGIQSYFFSAALGGGVAQFFQIRHDQYAADKDAAMRHYIDLHPEDFPPPERKRVGEVFQTFYPIR